MEQAFDLLQTCGHCGATLPGAGTQARWEGTCPSCSTPSLIETFPAACRPVPAGLPGELRTAEEQAACFVHADRVAEGHCEGCGRFMCALCAAPIGGKAYCVDCLARDTGPRDAQVQRLDRYDLAARAAAVFPAFPAVIGTLIGSVSSAEDAFLGLMAGASSALVSWPLAMVFFLRARKPQSGRDEDEISALNATRIILLLVLGGLLMFGFFMIGVISTMPPIE